MLACVCVNMCVGFRGATVKVSHITGCTGFLGYGFGSVSVHVLGMWRAHCFFFT